MRPSGRSIAIGWSIMYSHRESPEGRKLFRMVPFVRHCREQVAAEGRILLG
jgi:hypothetical protein